MDTPVRRLRLIHFVLLSLAKERVCPGKRLEPREHGGSLLFRLLRRGEDGRFFRPVPLLLFLA